MHRARPVRHRTELSRRSFLAAAGGGLLAWSAGHRSAAAADAPPELKSEKLPDAIRLTYGNHEVLRYQLSKPRTGGPRVESGGYIHPLATPSGTIVTEVGPQDHPHHRGVFLGWVEMRGAKNADFWGWGEPAPTAGRRIVNTLAEANPAVFGFVRFRAINEWRADGQRMVSEELRATARVTDGGTVVEPPVRAFRRRAHDPRAVGVRGFRVSRAQGRPGHSDREDRGCSPGRAESHGSQVQLAGGGVAWVSPEAQGRQGGDRGGDQPAQERADDVARGSGHRPDQSEHHGAGAGADDAREAACPALSGLCL